MSSGAVRGLLGCVDCCAVFGLPGCVRDCRAVGLCAGLPGCVCAAWLLGCARGCRAVCALPFTRFGTEANFSYSFVPAGQF